VNLRKLREKAGGERVLPPPPEVMERDNQAAMSYPPAASPEPIGYNIPTEQV